MGTRHEQGYSRFQMISHYLNIKKKMIILILYTPLNASNLNSDNKIHTIHKTWDQHPLKLSTRI
jgi:hypothetical protein